MGWGVTDYPSAPRERSAEDDFCDGCGGDVGEEMYRCAARFCAKQYLCVGCSFTCLDCQQEFCGTHIADVHGLDDGFAEWVCETCLVARRERKGAAA